MQWWVVIPVKGAEGAKTRFATLDADRRGSLAAALARDTIDAVLGCPRVAQIVVVGSAPDGLTDRVTSLADPGAGLNAAIRHAASTVPSQQPVAVLLADLPAATPTAVARALDLAGQHDRSFICDAAGTGTTMLAARAGVPLDPRFGVRSRAAHAASGATEVNHPDLAVLHRDVDSDVDLWDAVRMGVGAATSALLTGPDQSSAWLSGTCLRWSPDGAMVLDDGTVLPFDAFVEITGLTWARPGQRLSLRASHGRVVAVRWPTGNMIEGDR